MSLGSLFANPRRYLTIAIVAGSVLVLDQLTKAVVLRTLELHESIPVIEKLFSLTYIRNPGAAFGLFSEHGDGLRMVFFLTVSFIAIIFLLTLYSRMPPHDLLGRLAASMVMGGALGNLVDRVRFGEVVDFLDFYIGRYHWPAFNVADSCITVGVALLMWYFIRQNKSGQTVEMLGDKPSPHG